MVICIDQAKFGADGVLAFDAYIHLLKAGIHANSSVRQLQILCLKAFAAKVPHSAISVYQARDPVKLVQAADRFRFATRYITRKPVKSVGSSIERSFSLGDAQESIFLTSYDS